MNRLLLLLGALALSVLPAQAVLETFSYGLEEGLLVGSAGGSGFTGPWVDAMTPDNARYVPAGLSAPVYDLGFTAAGGALRSPVGAGANLDFVVTRPLATPVNLAADGVVYFSFLVSGEWTTTSLKRGWNFGFSSSATALSADGITVKNDYNTGTLLAAVGGSNTGTGTAGFNPGGAYLVIGSIQSSAAGPDTLRFTLLGGNESVPAEETWEVSTAFTSSATLGNLLFSGRVNDVGSSYAVDEIRLGSTWASVTPVPEPSALALLGLAGLGAAILARRRR